MRKVKFFLHVCAVALVISFLLYIYIYILYIYIYIYIYIADTFIPSYNICISTIFTFSAKHDCLLDLNFLNHISYRPNISSQSMVSRQPLVISSRFNFTIVSTINFSVERKYLFQENNILNT